MPEIQASRRLVKSPPELWAEVSDAASLARHLGEVGEIRITRLEPETTVAWEGERASGTVALAPAGWGTSVTLTAQPIATEPEPVAAEPEAEPAEPVASEPEPAAAAKAAPEPPPEPAPAAAPEAIGIAEPSGAEQEPRTPEPKPRRGWFARLFKRRMTEATTATEAEPSPTDVDRAGGDGETTSAVPPAESSGVGGIGSGPARSSAEPEPDEPTAEEPTPDPLEAMLTGALDSLGQAHHRPFSRG
ncbi:MAG TPA: hypothetical protein VFS37_06600 [Conexibacter sp.]|nr:hypothetical protein [Conexibacter sp.]